MKESIQEYYPNGRLKYKLKFHDNGNKRFEQYYDEKGECHNENGLPDYQLWDENGRLSRKSYCCHGKFYNICNLAHIRYHKNEKINRKSYYINNRRFNKLDWQNNIKNI